MSRWATALALLVSLQAVGVEIPKDFGKNIFVAEMTHASGKGIDEGRFLLCTFLFADDMQVLDKPQPSVVAVHTNPDFDQLYGMTKYGVKVEVSTSQSGQKTYWAYLRDPNDYAYLLAVARIFSDAFGLPEDKRLEVYQRVRTKFLVTVDVKSMEKH